MRTSRSISDERLKEIASIVPTVDAHQNKHQEPGLRMNPTLNGIVSHLSSSRSASRLTRMSSMP